MSMRWFSGSLGRYAAALALVTATTGVVALVRAVGDVENASMLYLLAVMASALVAGSRAAILAAIASFLAYNFFFLEPHYTLALSDDDQWVALGVLLITALITGQLAAALQDRAREAETRELEAVVLYDVVRLMSEPEFEHSLTSLAERLVAELNVAAVVVEVGGVKRSAGTPAGISAAEASVSRPGAMLGRGKGPEAGTRARPGRWVKIVRPARSAANPRYQIGSVPVPVGETRAGWIVLASATSAQDLGSGDDRLLSAVAHQLGLAIERLQLQREATEAEVLRRTDEQRRALLNAVSHDLRTPLSSILASAGSLLQEDVKWTEAQHREFAALIAGEAERLDRLVGNLLDLSRIEAGSIRPELGWYDLGSLIAEVIGRSECLADGRSIVLDVPDGLAPLQFDYVEIEQVLTNLVENAVRHTRAGVEIVVSARPVAGNVRVEVIDNGTGIPETALPHVFTAFYRGNDSGSGNGLGLAVAKGFVEAHGGKIWAENMPRGGARFVFTLPATAPAAAA